MSVIEFDTLPARSNHFILERSLVAQDVGAHTHDFIELAYLESGTLWHKSNGQSQRIYEGEYFLIDYTVPHILECRGNRASVINCIFRPAFLDATLKDCRSFDGVLKNYLIHFDQCFCFRPHSGEVLRDENGEILRTLHKIEQEYGSNKAACMELIRAYLIEIIILTIRKLQVPGIVPSDDLQLIQDLVSQRYAEDLLLEKLAGQLHISLPHLSRKFKKAFGYGFKDYLQHVRIEEACRLLANTENKIADIAERVGYQDLKFFNLLFRRCKSTSPSEYRRRHR